MRIGSLKYVTRFRVSVVREGAPLEKIADATAAKDAALRIAKAIVPRDSLRECFYVMVLDTRNRIVGYELIAIGSGNGALVHPREVFMCAIRLCATAIILVHSHPSGDPGPSKEDCELTNQLVKCGGILGIPVLDHIIVGDTTYSFKERGLM